MLHSLCTDSISTVVTGLAGDLNPQGLPAYELLLVDKSGLSLLITRAVESEVHYCVVAT
jgi:hypothetical protein